MRAFVDGIESGIATLLLGEDESVTIRVPVKLLPAQVREGDVLRIDCTIDPTATGLAKKNVQAIYDTLKNEP